MGCRIRIDYITNCAVLIQYGTVKILVDGIFSGRQPFDVMDPETEQQIMEGTGLYEKIDYVLFTHCHNDHYNGSKALRFLEMHPEAVVVVPENARLDPELTEGLRDRIILIHTEEDVMQSVNFDGFRAEYMKTGHLTFKYPEHYCLNVVFDTGNVLCTADMNLDKLPELASFTKKDDSWLFVNSIALWHKKWRRQVMDLQYEHICFYHLPSEERDQLGYRKKAMIHWKKHKTEAANWILLGE